MHICYDKFKSLTPNYIHMLNAQKAGNISEVVKYQAEFVNPCNYIASEEGKALPLLIGELELVLRDSAFTITKDNQATYKFDLSFKTFQFFNNAGEEVINQESFDTNLYLSEIGILDYMILFEEAGLYTKAEDYNEALEVAWNNLQSEFCTKLL